ncbi:hypothetical protein AWZ03_007104 [Drosophila navojoa]|uniref:Uncharacterized protein n=1 Tax=Drosophila navojoa TaxID=7232 RepID=A0A484BCJ8_DRONA|nr:zinc finger protein 853 [Drosophila navojoa]TDG46448.1 hypothetical protein AWZ03_007104 [Drosophila navojoa]
MNNNTAALELVCETANSLFPELNMRPNELSHPTEAFLTKVLICYLRSFGFRLEPPYNIESEAKDTSREKRLFLSKLCRQVERIIQISFPGKTFTYIDIIEPTVKKTSSTLDVLFNYRCFYKMQKKEILCPIADQLKERQALSAAIAAKRSELELKKQKAEQMKVDIVNHQASIDKMTVELPKVMAELNEQSKILQQKEMESALQEEQLAEINAQVKQFEQLLVKDTEVELVESQTAQILARIESSKQEMEKQEELFKERRLEIEANQQLIDELEKAMNILPPDLLNEYKENLKLKERMEKKHASIETKHQSVLASNEKHKQQLAECEKKLKSLKVQFEKDAQEPKQRIAELETFINQQEDHIVELQQSKGQLQEQMEADQCDAEQIKIIVSSLIDH